MAQLRGFEIQGEECKVYKLIKALYGFKQAPGAWHGKLDAWFHSQIFQRSQTEYTLYRKIEKNGEVLLVCVYVDDMVKLNSSNKI